MAEIGAISALVGIAGAGIKLSFTLFDLADRIGSAGEEVKLVATELSLFCSTLQALKANLEDTDNIHCTPAAYKLIDRIVQECQSVIAELQKIVSSLIREPGALSDFPSLEWTRRVKWTFKKSRVQVQRQTLESCKSTLHLLLSTLRWSRRNSTHRATNEDLPDESEQYQMITQGLVMAVRATVNQLRSLEAAADKEEDFPAEDSKLSRMLNGLTLQTSKPEAEQLKVRRTSTWLDKLVFDEEPEDCVHPGQRQRRFSSVTTANDPFLLLQKWTESRPSRITPVLDGVAENPFGSQDFEFAPKRLEQISPKGVHNLPRGTTGLVSPKSSIFIKSGTFTPTFQPVQEASIEAITDDELGGKSTEQCLSHILDQLGLQDSSGSWELVVVYGGTEKVLQHSDVPDSILMDLTKYKLNPRMVVRPIQNLGDQVVTHSS